MLRTVALVVLGASAGPWGDLQIGAAGTYGTGSGLTTASGLGSVSLSAYLHHRLLDDGAPLSLQPYLQRTGSVASSFLASGFSTSGPSFSEPYHGTTFGGSLSVDAYTGEVLTVSAAASFYRAKTGGGYPGFPGSESLLPRAELAPGVRFDDTRMSLGYRFAPTITDGKYDGRGFGELFLRVTSVVARRVYLSALGEVILSGGRGRLDVEVFPSQVLGLGAGFEFAQGAIYYDSRNVFRQWQPSATVSWWITPRAGLGLEYRFIHSEPVDRPGTPFDIHRIALALGFRLG